MSISSLVMAGVLGASAQVGESGSMITLNVQVDGFENVAGGTEGLVFVLNWHQELLERVPVP